SGSGGCRCTAARRRSAGRRASSLLGRRRTVRSRGIPSPCAGRRPPGPPWRFRCARGVLSVRGALARRGVRQGIREARLVESLEPELAGIAHAACFRPPMVARPRELPRDPQLLPLPDDLGLRLPDERRPNLDEITL